MSDPNTFNRKTWYPCIDEMQGHHVLFMGIGYRQNPDPRPGGSAKITHYAQIFMCQNCCQTHSMPLDQTTTNYEKILEGAFPATEEQIPASKSSWRY